MKRIQRQRTKGWRMPEGAVYVGRPTVFGNPFRVSRIAAEWPAGRQLAVDNFRAWLAVPDTYWIGPESAVARERLLAALPTLRGHDLACWCPVSYCPCSWCRSHLSAPCHADVLLELAAA